MFADSYCACINILLEVETYSEGIFRLLLAHGKSPCFLRCCFSSVVSVDCAVSVFAFVHVGEFLECALCHGKL